MVTPFHLPQPHTSQSLTLLAKRREFRDSDKFSSSGEMFTNISLGALERGGAEVRGAAEALFWHYPQHLVSLHIPFLLDSLHTLSIQRPP